MKLRRPTLDRPRVTALTALLILTAVFLGFASAPRRAFQLWSFTLPFALAIPWIGARSLGAKILKTVVWLGFAATWVDGGVRGFLRQIYGSDPKSSFVVESVANTNPSEGAQYLLTQMEPILPWLLSVVALMAAGAWLLARIPVKPAADDVFRSKRTPLAVRLLFVFALLICAVGWSIRPWRAQFPPLYWPSWARQVKSLQAQWDDLEQTRAAEADGARRSIASVSDAPKTIVLIIGESVVRDHWSLYGYARQTTPRLDALKAAQPRLHVIRNAWSVDSSTVAAFRSMFKFKTPESRETPENLFAFFEAAGYEIHWISNQDDMAIKNQYVSWADHSEFLNLLGGRSTVSLDEKVLAPLEEALASPAAKKLIVVHLIGAHPHYELRVPEDFACSWPEDDAVEAHLDRLNRSAWVKHSIDAYDCVMRYQDDILARTIDVLLASPAARAPYDWFFISDHGQELGEAENRTGHSNTTPGGYRIPFLWLTDERTVLPEEIEVRPFRADDLSVLLLDEAGIRLKSEPAERRFTSSDYRWRSPDIPDPEARAPGRPQP